jgi:hypothetical protein
MVLLLNETPASDDLELQNVSESYSGLKLEELLDEMQVLPFIQDDPCGEFGGVQGRIRDPTIGKSSSRIASSLESHAQYSVNGVAVECWKVLRTSQTPKNIGPQDLSLFPGMPIDILLEVGCNSRPDTPHRVSSWCCRSSATCTPSTSGTSRA